MSVISSSLVKTLMPSGGSLDKLVNSLATCLMIWGWRFSTFELVWNSYEFNTDQQLQWTIGEKLRQEYLPRPFAVALFKPKSKKKHRKGRSQTGKQTFVSTLQPVKENALRFLVCYSINQSNSSLTSSPPLDWLQSPGAKLVPALLFSTVDTRWFFEPPDFSNRGTFPAWICFSQTLKFYTRLFKP